MNCCFWQMLTRRPRCHPFTSISHASAFFDSRGNKDHHHKCGLHSDCALYSIRLTTTASYTVRDSDAREQENRTISCEKSPLSLSLSLSRLHFGNRHLQFKLCLILQYSQEGRRKVCDSLTDLEFVGQRLVVDDVGRPLGRDHLLHHVRVDGAAMTPKRPPPRGRRRRRARPRR